MRKCFLFVLIFLAFLPAAAKAESQDACAIWLCLPGGFPSGCSGAHSEFKHRIKKGKPPLPPLANCTVDGKTDGRYEMGREIWEACKDGYVLRESSQSGGREEAKCYEKNCAPEGYRSSRYYCESYEAVKRMKPNFVKMWVDGEYLGQFFY